MRKSAPENQFQLEGLEQRIMLSADPLLGALATELDRPDSSFKTPYDDLSSEVIEISSEASTQA